MIKQNETAKYLCKVLWMSWQFSIMWCTLRSSMGVQRASWVSRMYAPHDWFSKGWFIIAILGVVISWVNRLARVWYYHKQDRFTQQNLPKSGPVLPDPSPDYTLDNSLHYLQYLHFCCAIFLGRGYGNATIGGKKGKNPGSRVREKMQLSLCSCS